MDMLTSAAAQPLAGIPATSLFTAATSLAAELRAGRRTDSTTLKSAMIAAHGGTDAEGYWNWKSAYDACEAAQLLFLRQFGAAMLARAGSLAAMLPMLAKIAGLLPTHTRRSEDSQTFQQFSTPIALGLAASTAAAITPADLVLEPSAGTGLLAILAELAGGSLVLNELAETRAALLGHLFPGRDVTRFNAAQIDDYLDAGIVPSVVLMNPPFSAMANVDRRMADTALRHISSALARLAEGGRLVAITGASFGPDNPAWTDAFVRLQERGRVVFSAAIDGAVFAKHGTTVDTRLTVIDKNPADNPAVFPTSPGMAPDAATLLAWVMQQVPARLPIAAAIAVPVSPRPTILRPVRTVAMRPSSVPTGTPQPDAIELVYESVDWVREEGGQISDGIYEPYALQSIRIPGAQPHVTKLVQSAAMASVTGPKPAYRPHLPAGLVERGVLSEAQLESVIYAGEAHSHHLVGAWSVDDTFDRVSAAPADAANAVRFRRGWMLGDGTGAGKGRQAAGILLDNWLKGRRRAIWISKSDALLEDAQRDWSALGQERLLVTPLSRFAQGTKIRLEEGILFTTYATLRSEGRQEKASRIRQIIDWLGADFDGVILFDESHAMANAAGEKTERGDQGPSQQGRAGLRLQHALPNARIVYISATGATEVRNLAYAQRLGLWGGDDFPFPSRTDFIAAIELGGVAAMEVLARDLKALGLYAARSLSYEGVEYELLEHQLTAEQIRIYDAYAGAFEIIHHNILAALEAANVSNESGTLNRQAKAAARSAFENAKQRFFNHLITAMKVPSLIRAIDADLAAGHAALVQLVSTGEALTERRLAEIPTEEWNDVRIDITPREYVLDYLAHAFPTQLYEIHSDKDGNLYSCPAVTADGQPVQCREAVARRDVLIEHLASLPALHGALDQIVQHFGTDLVAEVTGRSRRIVRKGDRLVVESRPAASNLAETQAFMDDRKRIIVFSDAGGTGRSYHADLGAKNQRLRLHYLLEAGWRADTAIQGLGRSNRTNQAQAPIFRPIATDVKAERRFLSTIARRLDTLGAITKGQRQTGGQGLFRPEDNLESQYARDALRQLYHLIAMGRIEGCSTQRFEQATAISLHDRDGCLRTDLPPITTFLNRLLALTIELQNIIFTAFENLVQSRVEGAKASGTYDIGVEVLTAHSLAVTDRRTLHVHAQTGAPSRIFTIRRRDLNRPLALDQALEEARRHRGTLVVDGHSGHAAIRMKAPSITDDDGTVIKRVRLRHPLSHTTMDQERFLRSEWREVDPDEFAAAWGHQLAQIPPYKESDLHIVTGLLLPIWTQLDTNSLSVYRLQTDDGERIIGRVVSPAWVAKAVALDRPVLEPASAWSAILDAGTILQLDGRLEVRRVRLMNDYRIELTGFTDSMRESLKAIGLVSEIISWKLRLFIPTNATGLTILTALMNGHPLVAIVDKAAA
jgi:hypothetical protein